MPLSSVLGAQSLVRPGVCTSSTRPASPFEGQVIYETDTDLVSVYNGSGWKALGNLKASTNTSVLQVVSTTKTDTFTTTSTSYVDVTGLSLQITPSSTSNKILLLANIQGNAGVDTGDRIGSVQLVRDSTAIAVGDAAGSRTQTSAGFGLPEGYNRNEQLTYTTTAGINHLDSPSTTSATTYKIQVRVQSGGTLSINRSITDTDSSSFNRLVSTIMAMEIAG